MDYDRDALKLAVRCVVEEGVPIRRAAEMYNVPKSTLGDQVSGKVCINAKPGPSMYLTQFEEDELTSFLIRCSEIGFPRSRNQILGLVQQIINNKGIDRHVSNGWWERFVTRHPNISLRTPMALGSARAKAADRGVTDQYYQALHKVLCDNNLINSPGSIFNCNETGLPLSPKSFKIVAEKGAKNPSNITSGTKTQITVLACTCPAGYAIPPFIIFARESYHPHLSRGEVPGTLYGFSPKGWMTQELFYQWFKQHFLKYAPGTRPLLLLVDGHSSHYCPDFIRMAAAERVLVFVLPPHTSHLSQPLDKGCFSPLKVYWRQACQRFYTAHPGINITSYDFVTLFSEAWSQAMTLKNITASYRVTGIYPYDKSAIKLPDEKITPDEKISLAYIPLYSPGSHVVVKKPRPVEILPCEADVVVHVNPTSSSISQFLTTPVALSKKPVS